MRLSSVVITAFFLCLLFAVVRNAVFYVRIYDQKTQEYFLSYSAKKFISQSFKNTCSGKGFKNLEQWKNVCSALFNLESIVYEDDNENQLAYAKWQGGGFLIKCSGEVYYKNWQENYENKLFKR